MLHFSNSLNIFAAVISGPTLANALSWVPSNTATSGRYVNDSELHVKLMLRTIRCTVQHTEHCQAGQAGSTDCYFNTAIYRG